MPGRERGPCLFGEKGCSDKVLGKRQRCAINKRNHNTLQNIVLIALAVILVVAVAVAAGMAGRIRKREQAGPAGATAPAAGEASEHASEAEVTSSPAGSQAPEDVPEAEVTPAPMEGAATENSSESGAVQTPAEGEAAEHSSEPEDAQTPAEGEAAEDSSEDGTADAGSGSDSTLAPFVKTVHVEVDGKTVLETPLTGESKYAIIDGRAVELEVETTLADMQGLADPANHDVNLIYIHDGRVACSESNCENQVCVHTGELTGSAFDLPIICLPHGVVVQVID